MVDLSADLGRIAVSLFLGMVVGLEREFHEKPAGLKTNVLICLGSTLYTLLSMRFAGAGSDPSRVAAQLVTGIGFLGAGAILRDGEQVLGLTTAATIWVVAAVGMGVGMGEYSLAGVATLAVLLVQLGFTRLDMWVDAFRQRHHFKVVTSDQDHSVEVVGKIFRSHRVHVLRRKIMKRGGHYHSEWLTNGSPEGQEKAARELLESAQVVEVIY